MFTSSLKRQREIREDAQRFVQVYRAALAYANAGEGQTAKRLMNAIPPGKSRPKERAWLFHNALRRSAEILRKQDEEAEEEIKQEIAAAKRKKRRRH